MKDTNRILKPKVETQRQRKVAILLNSLSYTSYWCPLQNSFLGKICSCAWTILGSSWPSGMEFLWERDDAVPHTTLKIQLLFCVSFSVSVHIYYRLNLKSTPLCLFFLTKVKGFSNIPVLPQKPSIH